MDAIYEATRRLEASMDMYADCSGPRSKSRCIEYMVRHTKTLIRAYAEEFGLPKRVVESVIKDSGLIRDPDALISILNEMSLTEEYA